MAKLEILEFPDPRLRLNAQTVDVFDAALKRLADDMLETMYTAPGIGLAATQVNEQKRLLVTDVSEGRDAPLVLVNPELLEAGGTEVCQEGCLSFPGVYADVERKEWVYVKAQDVTGKSFELEAGGLLAVCIQHEMDHLVGKVFVDYLSPLKRSLLLRKLEKQRRHAG
ncbi:MAG TPA: peptide deformylase [Rhodanobacteraceae bacterium]|jgi:peptide deformylase|nr:peptide deformylase [Rhodanobacteraceae bacterium]